MHFYTVNVREQLYTLFEGRRKALGFSQAELCRRALETPSTSAIQNIRRGASPSVETVKKLADALDLEFYVGPRREEGRIYTTEINGEEFASIPRYDAHLAAGGGAFNEEGEPVSTLAFRREWLARTGISPASACILSVRGDSMRPTLYDTDLVMIDTRRKQVRNRRIYAFVDRDGEARVKRLEAIPGRMILLLSDNPDHETELREGPDMDSLQLLGEVVWSAHTWLDQVHVKVPEIAAREG